MDRTEQRDRDASPEEAALSEHEDGLARIDIVEAGMQLWQRERPDLDCSGKAVVGRILRLQGVILRAVDKALKPFGLKYPAYAVLATLRVQADRQGMTPGELTQALLLSSGGTSNLLARLERDDLITRTNSTRDRRAVFVHLTPAGLALVDQAMEAHAGAERELIACLSKEEADLAAGLLSQVILAHEAAVQR